VIFKPGLVEKIIVGKKTMTRRPVKDGETACALDINRTTTRFVPGCRYVPGRDYAVQRGRGGSEVARIRIVTVAIEQLGDITPEDALAEGFARTRTGSPLDEFFAYWKRLHRRVDRAEWVWAIRFELTQEQRVRYLGRRGGYSETLQFALGEDTAAPTPDEPAAEWAPPAAWQADHSARRRMALEDAKTKQLDERLADALAEAERAGIDVNRHRGAIARRVEALERDLRKAKTRAAA
jgi:hypothetical protein